MNLIVILPIKTDPGVMLYVYKQEHYALKNQIS